GTWPLQACPMDGGSILKTADGSVHTLWRRENNLYFSTNDGAEQSVSKGRNPILIDGGAAGLVTVWHQDNSLQAAPINNLLDRASIAPEADEPNAAVTADGSIFLVWQDRGRTPGKIWLSRLSSDSRAP